MLNEMIQSIIAALTAEFGDGYGYRMEDDGQEPSGSCFFVRCLHSASDRFRRGKYFWQNSFCVQYFPATALVRRECNEAAERMLRCLERITDSGGVFQGTRMKWEVSDGILNFFVDYDFFVYRNMDEDMPFEIMESHIDGKEGD